jgi:creatinine amidohydrolase
MTWVEYDRRVVEDNPVVIVSVASTEQHGPHTPLGCDAIVGAEIADEVGRRTGALIAPQIAYGYKSQPRTGAGNHFPGNICVDAETLSCLVSDIAQSLAKHGVRKVCLLSSHFENQWFIIEAVQDALAALDAAGIEDMKIACMSYYEFFSPEARDAVFGDKFISWEVEHGAVMTTSILLHRRPEVVDRDAIPDHDPVLPLPYDIYPFDPARGTQSGALSASTIASAENGKLFFDEVTGRLSEALIQEFDLEGGPRT